MAWAPPAAITSVTPSSAQAARIVGCGSPPNSFCGGEASTICSTPATCAGTTFITTELGSTARPPGTYRPTRRTGTQRCVTVPPGTTSTLSSRRALGGVDPAHPRRRLPERGSNLRIELVQRPLQLGLRDPQMLRAHSVEALRGIEHGGRASRGDVVDHGTHSGGRGLDVELGARQGRRELGGAEDARAQVGHGEERGRIRHGVSLGAGRADGPRPPWSGPSR